ncbi:MAG: RHS repeat-associated core domain-containing protein, partial [Bacteroidota bacterium]
KYSSIYYLEVSCPDNSVEITEVISEEIGSISAQLLHRQVYATTNPGAPSRIKGTANPVMHRVDNPPSQGHESQNREPAKTGVQSCFSQHAPSCTIAEQQQQLEQVTNFQNQVDQTYLYGLTYPTELQSVVLCDGSIVYLLADQVGELVGDYAVLNSLPLNSPDDLITAEVPSRNPNALFAMTLDYQGNGNIREAEWKSTYHAPRKYRFRYDDLNRIRSADYSERGQRYNLDAEDLFTVSDVTYDAIGNIETLTRRGYINCGEEMIKGDIDVLTYNYPRGENDDPNSFSQLKNITDAAEIAELAEFGVKPQSGEDYSYDGAGRMTSDPHRGLSIEYNFLDLPRKISGPGGAVEIIYDATGRKRLHKVVDKYTRVYSGAMIFEKQSDENDYALEATSTGDGRLVYDKKNEEVYPEYHHRDHLGNVRVAFTDRNKDKLVEIIGNGNEVTQVIDFYPFGLQQEGEGMFGPPQESSNRYRYNGKEFSEEIGLYDYGARWYDPAIARWNAVDPLAGDYAAWSPYNYVMGNPLKYIDPDGMRVDNTIFADQDGNIIYQTQDDLDDAIVVIDKDKKEAFL